jgi:hypothetical protein
MSVHGISDKLSGFIAVQLPLLSMTKCLATEASCPILYVRSNRCPFVTDILLSVGDVAVRKTIRSVNGVYPSSRFVHILVKQIFQTQQTEFFYQTYHVGISANDFPGGAQRYLAVCTNGVRSQEICILEYISLFLVDDMSCKWSIFRREEFLILTTIASRVFSI